MADGDSGPYVRMTVETTLQEPSVVLDSLRGEKVVLGDLNRIFDNWPKEINPNLDQLRRDVDVWLERCGPLYTWKRTMPYRL